MHSGWKQELGKNSRRQARSEALRERIAESPRQAGAQGLQQQDSPTAGWASLEMTKVMKV